MGGTLVVFVGQAVEAAVTAAGTSRAEAKTALLSRLAAVEEQVVNTQSMVRTLETQVPAISDLRRFATREELADKADVAAVNEVTAR
jgi:hypothetical protein